MTDTTTTARLDRLETLTETLVLSIQQQQKRYDQVEQRIQQDKEDFERKLQQEREESDRRYQQIQERMDREHELAERRYQQVQEQFQQQRVELQQQRWKIDQNSQDLRESMVEAVAMMATLGQQIEENSTYIRGLQAENRNILSFLMDMRQHDNEE